MADFHQTTLVWCPRSGGNPSEFLETYNTKLEGWGYRVVKIS